MDEKKEFMVGIFVVIGIIILIFSLFFLGKVERKKDYYSILAEFDTVNNLEIGTPVILSGVKVGKVKSIYLNGNKVIVEMYIKKDIKIIKGARITIVLKGIIGEQLVSIYNLSEENQGYYKNGDKIKGENPVDLNMMVAKTYDIMNSVQKLTQKVDDMMNENSTKEIVGNMKVASEKLNIVIDKTDAILDKTDLIVDKTGNIIDENRENIKISLEKMGLLISKTEKFIDKTDKILEKKDGEIEILLSETKAILDEISKITKKSEENIDKTLDNFLILSQNFLEITDKIDKNKIEKIQKDVVEIVDEMKNIVNNVKGTVNQENTKKIISTLENTEKISKSLNKVFDNKFEITPELEIDKDKEIYMNLNMRFDNKHSDYYLEVGSDNINNDYGKLNFLFGLTENKNDISAGIIKGKAGFRYQYNFNETYSFWFKYYDLDKSNILLNMEYNYKNSKLFLRYDIEDMFYIGAAYKF